MAIAVFESPGHFQGQSGDARMGLAAWLSLAASMARGFGGPGFQGIYAISLHKRSIDVGIEIPDISMPRFISLNLNTCLISIYSIQLV